MIFIKRLISIILICFCFLSFFAVSSSASETTDTTQNLNNFFDNPIGTGAIGSYEGYWYIKSPFDSDVSNVYWRNANDGTYSVGYLDEGLYPYWIILYDSDGTNLYILASDEPLIAKKSSGTINYVIVEASNGANITKIIYNDEPYAFNRADGSRIEVPVGVWRSMNSTTKSFIYSQDSYDSVQNFRFSSHDVYYNGVGPSDDVIFPKTAYNPVIKKGTDIDTVTRVDSYEEFLGNLINDIVEGLDFLDDFFQPLFDFLGEFWDDHVVGYLQTLIDNFTYYFKKFAIPDITFFEENFDGLYYGLATRFPVLNDISDMYTSIQLAFENADNTPNISFTYKGQTYNLLDLSLFDPVMPFVHSVILVFAYYRFLSGLYKKLPNMI